MTKEFFKTLLDALLHVLITIGKLFLIPFNLWVKSVERLVEQKKSGLCDLASTKGLWPFLSYLKNITLEFNFDAVNFLSYPVGILFSFVVLAKGGAVAWIIMLINLYFFPIYVSLTRDFFQLAVLPFRKLIDWLKKPAQYLEINDKK